MIFVIYNHKKEYMRLPQILTDKEELDSHIQEVRKMGERARMEGKVYKLCMEDDHLNDTLSHFVFTLNA